MNRVVVPLFLIVSASFAQAPKPTKGANVNDVDKGVSVTFHVTAVRQEDDTDCDPSECTSKKFTIEGYTDGLHIGVRISYVLTCNEYWRNQPTPHITLTCARVHANNDYDVKLFSESVSFWPEGGYNPPPLRGFYRIVFEKEITNHEK